MRWSGDINPRHRRRVIAAAAGEGLEVYSVDDKADKEKG
jgi:hypothetical protein